MRAMHSGSVPLFPSPWYSPRSKWGLEWKQGMRDRYCHRFESLLLSSVRQESNSLAMYISLVFALPYFPIQSNSDAREHWIVYRVSSVRSFLAVKNFALSECISPLLVPSHQWHKPSKEKFHILYYLLHHPFQYHAQTWSLKFST